jgi:hypothetical protein
LLRPTDPAGVRHGFPADGIGCASFWLVVFSGAHINYMFSNNPNIIYIRGWALYCFWMSEFGELEPRVYYFVKCVYMINIKCIIIYFKKANIIIEYVKMRAAARIFALFEILNVENVLLSFPAPWPIEQGRTQKCPATYI